MKQNFKIAGILGLISLICALIIAGMNLLTSGIIEENSKQTELETITTIFSDYSDENSKEIEVDSTAITKLVKAYNSSNELLGYLYTVTGSNAYGDITLMVAINDEKVIQVEFLENTQSFASTVVAHVQSSYPCSASNTIYIGIQPDEVLTVGALSKDDVANIDVSCGATYGATLVKTLVLECLNDGNRG